MPDCCPTETELCKLYQGILAPHESAELGDHLDRCARCLNALNRMEHSDTLGRALSTDDVFAFGGERGYRRFTRHVDAVIESANRSMAGALEDPQSDLDVSCPIPDRIGPYIIVRAIGRGGMGTVFEAMHAELHSRVAIKVLHSKGPFSPPRSASVLPGDEGTRATVAPKHCPGNRCRP